MPFNASMAALVAGLLVPPMPAPTAVTVVEPAPRIETAVTVQAPPKLARTKMWLYSGYTALQIGDIVSTTANLRSGATEKNALLGDAASSPTKLTLIKAATMTATFWAVESLWKSGEKKGAIATLATVTAIAAIVFAKNMRTYAQIQALK